MRSSRERRLDNEGADSGPYILSDMAAFSRMIAERKKLKGVLRKRPAALDPTMKDDCSDFRHKPIQQEVKEATVRAKNRPKEQTAEEILTPINPADVWSSLDQALAEMGYDIYSTAIMLTKAQLPDDLVALVARKVSSTADRVRPMLEAQCPALLPPVIAIIEKIKKELDLQRIAQEEMARADELERERLRIKEMQRQKAAVLERVQMIGKCCMGLDWIKTGDGYRCAGGSHFVSDAQVNLV